jgi:glycosyltransferase involved in cell wall biosynthesis
MKVIFLSRFNAYDKDITLYRPGTDGFYLFGMGQFIAQEFMKRNYPVTFENWRMDRRIKTVMEKEVDGILCRIFPSKKIRPFGDYSGELIKALKREAGKKDVVFHFMPSHPVNYQYYARYIRKNTIITTHLGGANPLWEFKHQRKLVAYFRYLVEKHFLHKLYNHTITICKPEVEYYQKIKFPVTHMPIFGISREHLFTIKDRVECRRRLGLPLNKKILLQVGRAIEARGFDWIMELIDHYKNKEDYFMVFAGINETDKYYQPLKDKGVFMTPYLNHADLPDYYNAADIFYYLPHGELDLNFAGTSYVPLEAMACGTPVVATTFHHFPGDAVHEVSRIPKMKEDVIPMIEDLLAANASRERCREIVLNHFSWDTVIEKYWALYNQ